MFKHLFDFSYERSTWEAVGFYIAWAVLILLASMVVGAAFSIVSIHNGETQSYILPLENGIGSLVAGIGTLVVSVDVAKSKGLIKKPSSIILILIACALTLLVSFFLGLLVPAYLSTRKNESTVLGN